MGVSLKKGQKISLTKESPGLKCIVAGLGWDHIELPRTFFWKNTGDEYVGPFF